MKHRPKGSGSLIQRSEKGPWVAVYFDHTGKRRFHSTKTTDKAAANRILSKLVADTALRREGVVDPRADRFAEENRKPLRTHVDDYLEHCRRAGHDPKHVGEKERHLTGILESTGATRLSELTADALERHMWAMRQDGLSARYANFARQSAVAFLGWCVKTGRVEGNALKIVPKLDESKDRRRMRRALTDQELGNLLTVAEANGRKAWYLAAAFAGLRRGDLVRLTWGDLSFKDKTITIRHGKAKRTDVVPMHPQLAAELGAMKAKVKAPPTAKVFPAVVTNLTVQKDFVRAGIGRMGTIPGKDGKPQRFKNGRIKYRFDSTDPEGRVADLHCLRATLGTKLARAGVAPQIAQRIMRHSDYRTTLQHYTVLGLVDTAKAVGQLPQIETKKLQALAATGTDGPPARQQYCQQLGREKARPDAGRRDKESSECDEQPDPKSRPDADLRDETHSGATRCETAGDATRTRNIQLGRLMLYH